MTKSVTLPVTFLGPRGEERRAVRHQPAEEQRIGGLVDHGREGGAIGPDERVPEIDRDGGDRETGSHAQRATLDGQMSRNGQYVQASVPGFGV